MAERGDILLQPSKGVRQHMHENHRQWADDLTESETKLRGNQVSDGNGRLHKSSLRDKRSGPLNSNPPHWSHKRSPKRSRFKRATRSMLAPISCTSSIETVCTSLGN